MTSIHAMLGIAAGIVEFLSLPIYIRSILRGETKPDRVTWWILTLVSAMIAASYYAAGARDTIWLPIVYTICMLAVALLSLQYGEGTARLSTIDRISLGAALISGFIWWFVRSPIPVLFMNICTEFGGLVPTINKAYRRPWTESALPWIVATIAAFLNVLAIQEWTIVIATYPVYVFITDAIIIFFILRTKKA